MHRGVGGRLHLNYKAGQYREYNPVLSLSHRKYMLTESPPVFTTLRQELSLSQTYVQVIDDILREKEDISEHILARHQGTLFPGQEEWQLIL